MTREEIIESKNDLIGANLCGANLCDGAADALHAMELAETDVQQLQAKICECKYCKDTGYLSALGESVQANEHSPGWKYCPYCSRKLSTVR